MLFTWDWRNTCVVYKWWHVKTFQQFLATMVAITLLAAGYEATRYWFARWVRSPPTTQLPPTRKAASWRRSLIYGFQVGYSFMLMLVFMTYNGWYMLATVLGAVLGHHIWGHEVVSESPTLACH